MTLIIGPYLKLDYPSLFLFCASFAFSDYLRAIVLSGFPWNLWAYSTSSFNEILQIVNNIGLYSYNLLVITTFSLPIIFFLKLVKQKKYFLRYLLFLLFLVFIFSEI